MLTSVLYDDLFTVVGLVLHLLFALTGCLDCIIWFGHLIWVVSIVFCGCCIMLCLTLRYVWFEFCVLCGLNFCYCVYC